MSPPSSSADWSAVSPGELASKYRQIESEELPGTIWDLVERAAANFGTATAVNFFERKQALSFVELRERANSLAAALHGIGIGHGTHVGVMLPNRIEFPVTWLAIARLGAVMVPIITSSTAREIAFVIDDADVDFLIAESSFVDRLRAIAGTTLALRSDRWIVVGGDASADFLSFENLWSTGSPEFRPPKIAEAADTLNIQYTSGTTGLPKGVVQNHQYWVTTGVVMDKVLDGRIRTILSDHPFYYMDPQWMLVMGLYSGARVDFSNSMSVRRFMGWVHELGSELAWFPEPLLKEPPVQGKGASPVKVFLGYACTREMVAAAQERYGVRLCEAYGMTEVGGALMVPPQLVDERAAGTCGLPMPFRRCRIADDAGNDVVRGEAGELWISGSGLSSGYYKRPEINRQLYVGGWFRTGDVFVQDELGYFRIVGRIKDMIKRSGENISAFEVEMVLKEMPEIQEAAVVPVPDDRREQEVLAFVQLRAGLTERDVSPRVVLAYCAERLAPFKVPRFIQYVGSFPYTASDKVAKHLLLSDAALTGTKVFDADGGVWKV